jgi:hypothetical protein
MRLQLSFKESRVAQRLKDVCKENCVHLRFHLYFKRH